MAIVNSISKRVANDSGMKNAKVGMYNGKPYTFTHRNPKTGELYGEDIPVSSKEYGVYGKWVPAEKVTFVD